MKFNERLLCGLELLPYTLSPLPRLYPTSWPSHLTQSLRGLQQLMNIHHIIPFLPAFWQRIEWILDVTSYHTGNNLTEWPLVHPAFNVEAKRIDYFVCILWFFLNIEVNINSVEGSCTVTVVKSILLCISALTFYHLNLLFLKMLQFERLGHFVNYPL